VIRDALAVYEALVRRAMDGNKFFYGPDSEHLTELDIVSLSQARHKAERERQKELLPPLPRAQCQQESEPSR